MPNQSATVLVFSTFATKGYGLCTHAGLQFLGRWKECWYPVKRGEDNFSMMGSEIPNGLNLDYILVPWALQGSIITDIQCKVLRELNIIWQICLLCAFVILYRGQVSKYHYIDQIILSQFLRYLFSIGIEFS